MDLFESKHPMNKRQLIDEIRQFNPTAQPQFLGQFQEDDLRQYLEHLQAARSKQIHISRWVRQGQQVRMVS
jgi:hypothetical protein